MDAKNSFSQSLQYQNLEPSEWIGEVVDNNDPDFSGRCRVRIFGKFDGRQNPDDPSSPYAIPDDHLPWAFPSGSSVFAGGESKGAGSHSTPKIGTKLKGKFSGGNIYAPEYFAVQDINEKMIDEIRGSYVDSHVLLFDEDQDLKVVYTPDKGLEIYLKESRFLINPDSSITIEHKETQSIIELVGPNINITANSTVNVTANSKVQIEAAEAVVNGQSVTKLGPAPTYSGVLAEPLWAFLKVMASAIDAKLPTTPGVISTQALSFEQLSTSKNVKLSS